MYFSTLAYVPMFLDTIRCDRRL